MQLLSILGLFALQMTLIEIKQAQQERGRHILLVNAEQALTMAEDNLSISLPGCIVPNLFTADLLAKPLIWWQSFTSCTGNFQSFEYYYVVEFLGSDPCATVPDGAKQTAADYFRITLLGMTENAKIILQSTTVLPHHDTGSLPSCQGVIRAISQGRQMRRDLTPMNIN